MGQERSRFGQIQRPLLRRASCSSSYMVLSAFFLGTVLLGTGVCEAAGRPVVIDLTTLTANPRTDALSPFISQSTPLKAGTYPMITASNAAFVSLYHWVYPSSAALECPYPRFKLDDTLVDANKLIQELELDKAIERLEQGWSRLPCQVEPLTRATLRRFFYLEGIAYYYQGDTDSSQRAFLEAMAIEPSLIPLEGFAPEINDAYLTAARGLSLFKPVTLTVDSSLRKSQALINGEKLPDGATLELRPGRHVLQKAGPEGVLRTATFSMADGEQVELHKLAGLEPPEPASVLRELLRSALLGERLSSEQEMALSAYAAVKGNSYLLFVAVNAKVPGALKLLIFQPGKGLVEGIPADLAVMDPLPAETRPAASGPGAETAGGARPSTGKSGGEKTSSGKVARPPGLGDDPGSASSKASTAGVRLSLGSRTYNGRSFMTVVPDFRLMPLPFLEVDAALIYGVRGSAGGAQQLYGLRVGAGVRAKVGSLWLRAQPGLSALAVDVLEEGETASLLLQLMPEVELGIAANLTEQLEVSAYSGLGLGPGLIGEAAFAWTSGLGLGLAF